MDNRGSSSIEIMIILVVIVLIFGVVLTSVENATTKIVKSTQDENLQLVTSEVVDTLINNPGSPENWYELKKGTPGLSIVNEGGEIIPNSVSWTKFLVLGDNYKKLVFEKLFSSKIQSSIELIPQKSSISSVKIGSNDEAGDVYSINRMVKCDFLKKYVIKDFQNPGKCNHNHDQSSHSCNYFKMFKGNVKKYDYYLLLDSNQKYKLKYFIDTTRVVKARDWQTTTSDKIYLNNKVSFYDDTSAVVFIHFDKPKTKAVLISVPKNYDSRYLKYDYFRTNDCQLIFKAWY